jgi:hypothetical protein
MVAKKATPSTRGGSVSIFEHGGFKVPAIGEVQVKKKRKKEKKRNTYLKLQSASGSLSRSKVVLIKRSDGLGDNLGFGILIRRGPLIRVWSKPKINHFVY